MSSGYPGRDLRAAYGFGFGSAVQFPYHHLSDASAASGGPGPGLLKRSLTELERQQQIQHALYMRSVKQRTQAASSSPTVSISSALLTKADVDTGYNQNCSINSYLGVPNPDVGIQNNQNSNVQNSLRVPKAEVDNEYNLSIHSFLRVPKVEIDIEYNQNSSIHNCLQELERRLLDDDVDEASPSESAVTDELQHLISPPPPPPPAAAAAAAAAPSPTTSSSSTTSSTASSSPTGLPTPSRQLLLDTAAAIADSAMDTATGNLAALNRAADRRGDPEQRLTAMMVAALLARINPRSTPQIPDLESHSATQLLFDLCPCFKLGLLAANLAILDATRDSNKLHILDFDVGQGGQHAALVTALADRHRRAGTRPPSVKITAVDNGANLTVVGDRIASLAERLGVALRFNIVRCRVSDVNNATIVSDPGEALAVNFAFHLSRVADESVSVTNPRDELLRNVRALSPKIVVMVEQEVNGNTAGFAARFADNCAHYGALLESLDATAARDSVERQRVEAGIGLKVVNSVSREGAERVERCEVFGKWRARMGMAGLQPVQLGKAVVEPVRARLALLRGNPGFTVREEGGGLGFGWMGRVLITASAWRQAPQT